MIHVTGPGDATLLYRQRIARVQQALRADGVDALLDLTAADVYYLTGFFYNPTERPAGVLVPQEGDATLLLPLLDIDQAREECWIRGIETYFEYPGVEHPLIGIGRIITRLGYGRGTIAVDEDVLSMAAFTRLRQSLPEVKLRNLGGLVGKMRQVKEEAEIQLIRQAARYADFMQEVGLQTLRDRLVRTEFDLLNRVLEAVTRQMALELSEIVSVRGVASGAVVSGYRTAYPHGTTKQRQLRRGEPVMLSFGCSVGGYRAENTRTYFLGDPSPEGRSLYELVCQTQEYGRGLIAPGQRCAAVNGACLSRLREAGQEARIRHRVGHGIGLEGHEAPWIEDGDGTVLAPNMVVSVEPGLYDPAIGGILISDTVLVSERGAESLTNSVRELDGIIIPW